MAINLPVQITYTNDKSSLKKATKQAEKPTKSKGGGGPGVGAIAGGVAIGNLLGSMLGKLDGVQKIMEVIGQILNAFITPFIPILLTLLKPFLALFLVVGAMMAKWLQGLLKGGTGKAGEGAVDMVANKDGKIEAKAGAGILKSLAVLGIAIGAIVATIMGAPIWLAAAVALLVGFLANKFGEVFINFILGIATWVDALLGTDLLGAFTTFFQGITDAVMGLIDILWSLLTLDWEGVKSGLIRMFTGLWNIFKGIFLIQFEVLKAIMLGLWELLKSILVGAFELGLTIGDWIWTTITNVLTGAFNILSGIGSWIKDKVLGFFSFGRGGGSRKVNDAVISPSGKVISTSPQDYLIATKTPGSLGGGGGGNNITVNINGNASGDDADKIARVIMQKLRHQGSFSGN